MEKGVKYYKMATKYIKNYYFCLNDQSRKLSFLFEELKTRKKNPVFFSLKKSAEKIVECFFFSLVDKRDKKQVFLQYILTTEHKKTGIYYQSILK